MIYPHAIRLRGPWQFEPLARSVEASDGQIVEHHDDLPPPGRGTVPSDWGAALGTDFRGRVAYSRSFNPPGTLDPHERLWLVVEGVDAWGVVSLNGTRLGEVPGYAVWSGFDITRLVGPRNEVTLEVELHMGNASLRPGRENLPGGPIGEVRLEVRSQQFIEGLALFSCGEPDDPRLAVRGRIGGESSESTLAVVVGALDRELAYLEAGAGAGFEAVFPAAGLPIWRPDAPLGVPVEVKLLDGGSSVWRQALETGFRAAAASSDSVRLDAILSEGDYREFDRKGTTIVQHVPSEWIESVCPRLAHHPSIVAWSGPGEPSSQSLTFGRPWL
jgi:beta-galactosidase/beta-glucuronidase